MMNLGELQYCVAQEILSLSHEVSVRTFTDNTDEWTRVVLAEFATPAMLYDKYYRHQPSG